MAPPDRGSVIEDITTEVVLVPLARPVGTSIHQITSVGCVLVTVRTADGVSGEGFCFTIDGDRIGAFDEMVQGLARYGIGRSVFESGRIWADVWSAINPTGHKGVTIAGFAAIDTAVWDAAAKTAGLPLHHMWGAVTDVGYSGAENALTVNGSDGEGIRQKWYGSGTYAAVAMFPAGTEDFSMWPQDAKRVA